MMTFTEESLQAASDDLRLAAGGTVAGHEVETSSGRLTAFRHLLVSGRLRLGLIFAVGLLVGWMLIGWWIWPVRWFNSFPWLLEPEYQRIYVGLVAEDYWHNNDVSRVKRALTGWEISSLNGLLTNMHSQATTPEERQRLEALAAALALPDPEKPLRIALFEQKVLWLGVFFAALPLVAAIGLAIQPLIQRGVATPGSSLGPGVQELEAELEQLLIEESRMEAYDEGIETKREAIDEMEMADGYAGEDIEGIEKGEDEEGEADGWLEEEIGEEGDLVGDILSDIFEEEDETSMYYRALCEGLEEIKVDDLTEQCRNVLAHIVRSNELRKQ